MRKFTLPTVALAAIFLAICMTGCNSQSTMAISVILSTAPAPTIDQGQVVTITATIFNDTSNKGVTWSLSGLGSLSNQTPASVTYVAPSSVTTAAKVTVTATSAASTNVMTSISIQVNPPPSVATTSLPPGTAGVCYGQTSTSSGVTCNGEALTAAGGTPPYTWGVIVAGLPPGLSLNAGAGAITGTPTTPGTYSPKFSVTDSVGLASSATINMTIAPPPALTISTASLPNAAINLSYNVTLEATGGVAPYNWSLFSGSLPNGLQLHPSGVISGAPTATGPSSFTVQVTDSEGPTAVTVTKAFSLIVNPMPFSITTTALPGGTVGIAYSTTLQSSGGTAPVTWSIASGALPTWAALNSSTGVISGTPTAAGTTTFAVKATDSETPTAALAVQSLSIAISSTTEDSLLNGQYAFSLGGFDGGLVGSFTADGQGHITAGSEDMEDAATGLNAADAAISSGSYTIGADNRGVLSFTDANSHTFTFDLALSAQSSTTGSSTGGAIIETDASGDNFTGSFALQSSSGFSSTVLTGGYAFGFSGWDSSRTPDVVVGSATISSGSVSNGLLDENDGGTPSSNVSFTGTLSVDSSGRGTIISSTSQANFVFYVISKTEWYAIAYNTSTGGVRTGLVEQQSGGPYSNASINGTMVLQSQSSTSTPAPQAEVGLLTSTGTGSASTSLDIDQGGVVASQADTEALSFTSTANGRFTVTPQTSEPLVGYMIAPNQAFVAGTGATPSFGAFESQSAGPFNASSLNGSFFVKSLPLVAAPPGGLSPTVSSGLITFDAMENLTGTIDSSHAGTVTTTALTDTYSVATNGRVSISPGGAIMYIVSSSKIIILSTGLAGSTNPLIQIAQR